MPKRIPHPPPSIRCSTLMIPVPCLVSVEPVQLPLQATGYEFLVVTIKISIYVMWVISVLDERPADADRRGDANLPQLLSQSLEGANQLHAPLNVPIRVTRSRSD